jgi:DNA-binding Xre family transcriptional regulator
LVVVPATVEAAMSTHRRQARRGKSVVARPQDYFTKSFKKLGHRIRELREEAGYSRKDMRSFQFSAGHWEQIEAGCPTKVETLLRICKVFNVKLSDLVRGVV